MEIRDSGFLVLVGKYRKAYIPFPMLSYGRDEKLRFLKSGDWLENAIQVQMSTQELDAWKRRSSLTPVEVAVNEGSQTIAHYFLVGSSGVRMVVYEDKN